jgi:hypothetical protein
MHALRRFLGQPWLLPLGTPGTMTVPVRDVAWTPTWHRDDGHGMLWAWRI